MDDTRKLSEEQRFAFEKFLRGENLFISGPGGSGKSYFIEHMVMSLFERGKIHQVTSTTGCSSLLLSNNIHIGGKPITVKTIHSWSGIRVAKGTKEEIVRAIQRNPRTVKEWKRCQCLVIDESSMMSKKIFDTLDHAGRIIRDRPLVPFGGIQLICLGDFYQLPPVGDRNEPATSQFCFESENWLVTFPIENHIEFTHIYRQNDEEFKEILMEIRQGIVSETTQRILSERIGRKYNPDDHGGVLPMKICPKRMQVTEINEKYYTEILGQEYIYPLNVTTKLKHYVESGDMLDEETLEKCAEMSHQETEQEIRMLTTNIPSDETVKLKKNTVVMCLVNLDIETGIVNGSIGVVEDFVPVPGISGTEMVPIVRFSNGVSRPMGRYMWQSSEFPVVGVSQLPLCLAYANSIHKMQGATLDVCEMNLGGSIFAEHQTYVALSRVRSLDGVYLTAFHPQRIKVNPKVREFYSRFIKNRSFQIESGNDHANVDQEPPSIGMGECPICLDRCQDACITPCKHLFCKDCIMRLFQCTLQKVIQCPMCRDSIVKDSVHPVAGSTKVCRPRPSSSSMPWTNIKKLT